MALHCNRVLNTLRVRSHDTVWVFSIQLTMAPTPIHRWYLPGIPDDVEVHIKRDDMTGSVFSGNKLGCPMRNAHLSSSFIHIRIFKIIHCCTFTHCPSNGLLLNMLCYVTDVNTFCIKNENSTKLISQIRSLIYLNGQAMRATFKWPGHESDHPMHMIFTPPWP